MTETHGDKSRPRVLVVSASVGSGHNEAARSILAALAADAPELEAQWVEMLGYTPRLFRAYYAGGYALLVSRLPQCYGLGFRLTDRPQGPRRGLMERRRLWTERLALRTFAEDLCRKRPALIVSTHMLPPPLIGWMKATGRLDVPQMVVVTDDEIHRFWYAENVERWFIPAAYGRRTLERWGVEPGRITFSGMPVHPKWLAPLDRDRVLREWRLPGDKRIVLVTGGVDFTCGRVVTVAREVARSCADACVVVLAGRNKKLLGRLARLPEAGRRLIGVPFTDRAHELGHVASLMITKPGGCTTAECLAKGTPMVFMKPVPGHEAGNARYFERQGVAVISRSVRDTVAQALRLLSDEPARLALADGARRLYRPATQTSVAAIRDAVAAQGGDE